jgi:hypothetical protein
VPKITGFTVVAGNDVMLAADPFGNNVALRCPACAWPVLFIARPNQRGSSARHPAVCHGCGAQYWIDVDAPSKRVVLHRVPQEVGEATAKRKRSAVARAARGSGTAGSAKVITPPDKSLQRSRER